MSIFNVCIESLSSSKSAYIFNRKLIWLCRDKEAIHFILKQIQISHLFIRLGKSTSAVGEYGEQEYHRSLGNVAGGRFPVTLGLCNLSITSFFLPPFSSVCSLFLEIAQVAQLSVFHACHEAAIRKRIDGEKNDGRKD